MKTLQVIFGKEKSLSCAERRNFRISYLKSMMSFAFGIQRRIFDSRFIRIFKQKNSSKVMICPLLWKNKFSPVLLEEIEGIT